MLTTMQIEAARNKANQMTDAQAAAELKAFAEAELARDKKLWAKEPKMIECAEADAGDLLFAAEMIAEGNKDIAYSHICSRDTVVRESVPSHIWAFIGGTFL